MHFEECLGLYDYHNYVHKRQCTQQQKNAQVEDTTGENPRLPKKFNVIEKMNSVREKDMYTATAE